MRKAAIIVGVGIAFTLTACGVADKPTAGAVPVPTVSVAGNPAATASPAPTATTATTATTSPAPQSGVTDIGCPATPDVLLAALKAKGSDIYTRAASPAALHDVSCHEKFAVAATVPDGQHQPSRIVFGYDAASRSWRPLNLGSSGFCAGYVPDHLAANLAGCTS
ncbi:hypothetical protein [Longispora urticae]